MKIIKPLILFIIIIGIVVYSCDKEEDNPDNSEPLVFTSITAKDDSLLVNTTTQITVVASGYNLTYTWYATKGEIIGSGSSVIYAAPFCTPGFNKISCTIKDGNNNSLTKSVDITVYV